MVTMPLELYTDGSSLRNPGMSGYAFIIRYYEDQGDGTSPKLNQLEFSQGYRLSTNNRMEVLAGIMGLRKIIELIHNGTLIGLTQINLYSDSEYFIKSINNGWLRKWVQNNWMTSGFQNKKPTEVKNKDLWEQVIQVQNQLQSMGLNLTMTHVQGHDTNEFNNKADQLAQAASNSNNYQVDEIYETQQQQRQQARRNNWNNNRGGWNNNQTSWNMSNLSFKN